MKHWFHGVAVADNPELDALKSCLDERLPLLIRSGESADTLCRVLRSECFDKFCYANCKLYDVFADIRAPEGEAQEQALYDEADLYLQALVLAYVVRFKAIGSAPPVLGVR